MFWKGRDAVRWSSLAPEQAAARLDEFRVIDVRQAHEFYGELGHVPGSELLPLDQLGNALDRLDPSEPILVVCRSGGRASSACDLLSARGFESVHNLAGGMIAWNAERRQVCAHDHQEVLHRCEQQG